MKKEKYTAEVEETKVVEEVVEETETVIEPLPMLSGVVANCNMLNIRDDHNKSAAVVAVVSVGTELMIEPVDFGDWYSVCLASGVRGFCMKSYVAVQQ